MIYDYTCLSCENLWEETQNLNDPVIEICPKCGVMEAKRLISGGTSFVLKGGGVGWAKNKYSSGS